MTPPPDGFVAVHDPDTNSFLFRYNPATREILIVTKVRQGSRHEKKPCVIALDAVAVPVEGEAVDTPMAVVV